MAKSASLAVLKSIFARMFGVIVWLFGYVSGMDGRRDDLLGCSYWGG